MEISELARNRAEEYGIDLWSEFVIPPYYHKLELLQSEKPSVIEGGRGSGKTMLLRYLCHDTQFSPNRDIITNEDLNRIGVYWKMDTQFARIMNERGNSSDIWFHAFVNMGVLILTKEILNSLYNISNSNLEGIDRHFTDLLDFTDLSSFDCNIPQDYNSLKRFFYIKYNQFQVWVSNYKKIDQPLFYPIDFLYDLIDIIKSQTPFLKESVYHVYIDEYENLLGEQKKIINTWLKHSQRPLIFNLAMKHNAFNVRDTLGEEKIVNIHDYRKFNIEDLLGNDFSVFASEIFLLKLKKGGIDKLPIKETWLFSCSSDIIEKRKSPQYKKDIEKEIKKIFPGISNKVLSLNMLNDKVIKNKILDLIENALKYKGDESHFTDFFDLQYPEATIIMPALLSRNTLEVTKVKNEFSLYKQNKPSEFTDWIANNAVGCILFLYGKLNRICPFYAGYDAFITMSKDNIRHFLELCYSSLAQVNIFNSDQLLSIDTLSQATAVKNVSWNMLKEIKALGPKGNLLYSFAIRLGTLFEEGRKKITQSEPEQTQFNIKDSMSVRTTELLNELVKWSVLYETKLTKQKDLESGSEYQLNPIYSSYFTISYRKKRRISLSNMDFEIIAFAEAKTFEEFIKKKYSTSQDLNNYIQTSFWDEEL